MDLSSFPTRPSLLSSSSGWRDRLQDASFRGVPFKVEEESAGTGRRVETHEYPNRDKPYTEDLGKVTFRPSITAYVVGDDCFDQRDRLIEALNKPGPGTLVHPTYGELKVCVDGEVRVSTSKSEGRIVRFDLKFVEAGELSYPTSGAATAQTLMSSCSALDDCISDSFSGFSIDGVADFVQNDVVGNVSTMLGYVSDAMKVVDSAVSDAARLLQGDISVLLPPPSSGKNFVEQVQKMWRTGKRLYGNASDLVTMIKTLSGVSLGSDLQPRGVWKTDSKTTATATQQRNVVASTLRTTAISEAAYAVTRLPAPTTSAVMQNSAVGQATTPAQSTGWPSVTHPALNNAPAVKNTVDLPTWEELTDIRDTLNTAIDKELSRTTSDALFLALRRVKADLNADINTRLEQSARIIQRTPDEVLPALVLAATWFDNAARDADIIRRNAITRAWTYRHWMGTGTVGVMIASSDLINPIPEESTETAARQHIGPLAPVAGSDLYVFRPVAHKVDFHIRVTPDTPEIRAAITAELRSFLLRDGYPQGELKVSRISEAISGANGEYSHQLLAPADNISIAKNELAVLGTISWT